MSANMFIWEGNMFWLAHCCSSILQSQYIDFFFSSIKIVIYIFSCNSEKKNKISKKQTRNCKKEIQKCKIKCKNYFLRCKLRVLRKNIKFVRQMQNTEFHYSCNNLREKSIQDGRQVINIYILYPNTAKYKYFTKQYCLTIFIIIYLNNIYAY